MSSDYGAKLEGNEASASQASVGLLVKRGCLSSSTDAVVGLRDDWRMPFLKSGAATFGRHSCKLHIIFSIHFSKVNFANGSFQWEIVTY